MCEVLMLLLQVADVRSSSHVLMAFDKRERKNYFLFTIGILWKAKSLGQGIFARRESHFDK